MLSKYEVGASIQIYFQNSVLISRTISEIFPTVNVALYVSVCWYTMCMQLHVHIDSQLNCWKSCPTAFLSQRCVCLLPVALLCKLAADVHSASCRSITVWVLSFSSLYQVVPISQLLLLFTAKCQLPAKSSYTLHVLGFVSSFSYCVLLLCMCCLHGSYLCTVWAVLCVDVKGAG